MKTRQALVALLLVGMWTGACAGPAGHEDTSAENDGSVQFVLKKAPTTNLPGGTDSNVGYHWKEGTLYAFNPTGKPWQIWRYGGPDLFHMKESKEPADFENIVSGEYKDRIFESTWIDADGTLYGWYHSEPSGVCSSNGLSAPRIGAARSLDNGLTWKDFGFILDAPPDSLFCESKNLYFAGGNGDFAVIADEEKEYFYFFISTFHRAVSEQGLSVARMRYGDRDDPVGKVWKWHHREWAEPGVGGQVTPIFPAAKDVHTPEADWIWGPSIHFNTHLNQFVMIVNRSIDREWSPDGFYLTFNSDLSNPQAWSKPQKLFAPPDASPLLEKPPDLVKQYKYPGNEQWGEWGPWYPQVLGMDETGTDKRAGRVARLFIHGESRWEIHFGI